MAKDSDEKNQEENQTETAQMEVTGSKSFCIFVSSSMKLAVL